MSHLCKRELDKVFYVGICEIKDILVQVNWAFEGKFTDCIANVTLKG
jgi:hypothetical protein